MTTSPQALVDALSSLSADLVVQTTHELLETGEDPLAIEDLLQQGMLRVEEYYEAGAYFLSDLIVAGSLFIEALSLLPEPDSEDVETRGKVIIGVVNEDIHDIGKDIVVQVLKRQKFDVLDLGVDVSPERFVDEIERFKPDVVALSGVMGRSPIEMKRVIDLLEERGLRNDLPIIIGGACTSETVCAQIGADAYAEGPIDTVNLCQRFTAEEQ